MMKRQIAVVGLLLAAGTSFGALPEVSNVVLKQGGDRKVSITYTLANAPAIVTCEILTNGVPIGAVNLTNMTGAVNRQIDEPGDYTIAWDALAAWPDHKVKNGGATAVVAAWPLDNPPDYMVIGLHGLNPVPEYYPCAEAIPGGLLTDRSYRTTKLVMKHIRAKFVPWIMGSWYEPGTDGVSNGTYERPFRVCMSNDYWIAVFETTQYQYHQMRKNETAIFASLPDADIRPMEHIEHGQARGGSLPGEPSTDGAYDAVTDLYNGGSACGNMRKRTGLKFDLPTEAQWEFACRGGYGEGYWGDGTPIALDAANSTPASDCGMPGLCSTSVPAPESTAVCGSYPPNGYGLYDMHGNVIEMVCEKREQHRFNMPEGPRYRGDLNWNGTTYLDGTTGGSTYWVYRGGSWRLPPKKCRAAFRQNTQNYTDDTAGFRLCLTIDNGY